MPQQVGGAQQGHRIHYNQLQEITHLLTTTTACCSSEVFVFLRMCVFIHKLQIRNGINNYELAVCYEYGKHKITSLCFFLNCALHLLTFVVTICHRRLALGLWMTL